MPVINLDTEDLRRLVGEGFDLGSFKKDIPMIGASVEKDEGGEVSVEFFPDRPDLFSVEGVARAYTKFIGKDQKDITLKYRIEGDSAMKVVVDPALSGIRPVIGAAYIKGVNIDDKVLVSIMNLQEKLHITVGRKRKKVAIGIHDASPLEPPFRYWAADPKEIRFIPLQKDEEWDLERIINEHEKGVGYSWILKEKRKYPIITDSKGRVLSFPPIINGELTRVTETTKDIFVDCTGWDLKAVNLAVNIVCSQLVDRGGTIEDVTIEYPGSEPFREMGLISGKWPKYQWRESVASMDWTKKWLGKDLSSDEISRSLDRMEYGNVKIGGGKIKCLVPPWRGDILHQADLVEDIAIGFGFESFEGIGSTHSTIGSERRMTTISRYIRQTLIGHGFLEAKTISLSNEKSQFALMGRNEHGHLKLQNPITIDHTMLRMSTLPSLISLLKTNKHRDLPQRLFETADIMIGNRNRNVLGGVCEDNKTSFTEIKGYVQRILQDLGISFVLEPVNLGYYIKGRSAAILVDLPEGKGGRICPFPELEDMKLIPLGHFGEIHPRIIIENELTTPVSAFEMDMDLIIDLTEI